MDILLKNSPDISSETSRVFSLLAQEVYAAVPSAIVEEVGSTSIPGALTKGDVDVLVEVSPSDFEDAQARLGVLYEPNEGMEGIPLFASFKGVRDGVDFGIQLSGERGMFGFVAFRNALLENPRLAGC
jgi:GrpB-like predicted nucleotidyltransferase (UPF0157 family)